MQNPENMINHNVHERHATRDVIFIHTCYCSMPPTKGGDLDMHFVLHIISNCKCITATGTALAIRVVSVERVNGDDDDDRR